MTEGFLLLDKPVGPTSHDVVEAVRRALGGARCGHAGTLDPFASGLLLVAVGKATRLLRFLSGADKDYEGVIRLGYATDTDDATGAPLSDPTPVAISEETLRRALESFEGTHAQVVPSYSARKHEGIPMYRLARRGRPVPHRTANVAVHWEDWSWSPPERVRFRVRVSAGTYIRALARDIGTAIGCGGHLEALRRIRSGPFHVSGSLPFPSPTEALVAAMLPLRAIPLGLEAVQLPPHLLAHVRAGRRIPAPSGAACRPGEWLCLRSAEGDLVAVAEVLGAEGAVAAPDGGLPPGELQPRVVL